MSHAVLYAVAHRFFVTPADLIGPSRQRVDVSPRAVAVLILHDRYSMSLNRIGRMLGGRDHSTIGALYRKAEAMVDSDAALADYVNWHLNGPLLPHPIDQFKPRAKFAARAGISKKQVFIQRRLWTSEKMGAPA